MYSGGQWRSKKSGSRSLKLFSCQFGIHWFFVIHWVIPRGYRGMTFIYLCWPLFICWPVCFYCHLILISPNRTSFCSQLSSFSSIAYAAWPNTAFSIFKWWCRYICRKERSLYTIFWFSSSLLPIESSLWYCDLKDWVLVTPKITGWTSLPLYPQISSQDTDFVG